MERTDEIRQILLGRLVHIGDGIWMADKPELPKSFRSAFEFQGLSRRQGVVSGSGSVRFFGITRRVCVYKPAGKADEAFEALAPILGALGRIVYLEEFPDAAVCYCRFFLRNPMLLTLEVEEDKLVLTTFTARTLFAWVNCRLSIKAFERQLPEDVIKLKTPKVKRSDKKSAKKAKKQKKKKIKKRDKEKTEERGTADEENNSSGGEGTA